PVQPARVVLVHDEAHARRLWLGRRGFSPPSCPGRRLGHLDGAGLFGDARSFEGAALSFGGAGCFGGGLGRAPKIALGTIALQFALPFLSRHVLSQKSCTSQPSCTSQCS